GDGGGHAPRGAVRGPARHRGDLRAVLREAAPRGDELPPARARLLQPDLQLPRVPAVLPRPPPADRGHARGQRLQRPDPALRRARGVPGASGAGAHRRGDRLTSEHRLRRRVHFYETDMAGLVHFSVFFRYMEEAEHALWRAAGLTIATVDEEFGFPRVSASFDFHA